MPVCPRAPHTIEPVRHASPLATDLPAQVGAIGSVHFVIAAEPQRSHPALASIQRLIVTTTMAVR